MSNPYRTAEAPSEKNTLKVGPIVKWEDGNHGRRTDRELWIDGYGPQRIGIWNKQRDGQPTVAVHLNLVVTREMWNTYKQAVDELFDEHEKP